MRGYVSIFVPGKRLVVYQKLNSMEAILPDGHFMRVHKSFIIALEKITAVEGNTAEIGDRRIPIGKSYRQEFFSRLPKA